jgi:hypothetical protein
MNLLIFLFGGWKSLQCLYPDRPFEAERICSWSSMYFGHSLLGSYRGCVEVAINAHGLRLRVPGLLWSSVLPPIVFDWQDIEECTQTRFGLVGNALKIRLKGWPRPIYVGRFLWKYGDVYKDVIERWRLSQIEPGARQTGN